MGLGVVLIFYGIVLTVIAVIGATVLGTAAYFLARKSGRWKRAVIAAAIFPFLCEGFAGAWFVVYAVINYEVFHRDPMLGDTWETPMPNGYALMMIDVTDEGTVYNPKTQPGGGLVVGREDAAFGVRQLQVRGNLIFGARDSGYFGRIGHDSKIVDKWFELDTSQNRSTEFASLEDLRREAAAKGVRLQLREFQSVFSDYRTTWFDYLAFAILLLTPLVGFIALASWIWRLRRKPNLPQVEPAG
jgi:hypothetical protein